MNDTKNVYSISGCTFKPRDGEYEQDGVWHCGKCKQPVQSENKFFGTIRVPCKCVKKADEQRQNSDKIQKNEKRREMAFGSKNSRKLSFTFDSDDGRNADVSQTLKKYCEHFDEMRKKGTGIVLYSTQNGGGKTFLACAVANYLIDQGYNVLVTDFLSLRDMLASPASYTSNEHQFTTKHDVFNYLCKKSLVVLDDLGAEQSTEFFYEVAYRVVECLNDERVPIIITTNYSLNDFQAETNKSKTRVFDRLLGSCALLRVDQPEGKSRRLEECERLTRKIRNLT